MLLAGLKSIKLPILLLYPNFRVRREDIVSSGKPFHRGRIFEKPFIDQEAPSVSEFLTTHGLPLLLQVRRQV